MHVVCTQCTYIYNLHNVIALFSNSLSTAWSSEEIKRSTSETHVGSLRNAIGCLCVFTHSHLFKRRTDADSTILVNLTNKISLSIVIADLLCNESWRPVPSADPKHLTRMSLISSAADNSCYLDMHYSFLQGKEAS